MLLGMVPTATEVLQNAQPAFCYQPTRSSIGVHVCTAPQWGGEEKGGCCFLKIKITNGSKVLKICEDNSLMDNSLSDTKTILKMAEIRLLSCLHKQRIEECQARPH